MIDYNKIMIELETLGIPMLVNGFFIDPDSVPVDIYFLSKDFQSFITFLKAINPKIIFINTSEFNYENYLICNEDIYDLAQSNKIEPISIATVLNDKINQFNDKIALINPPSSPISISIQCLYEGKNAYFGWQDDEFLKNNDISYDKLNELFDLYEEKIMIENSALMEEKHNKILEIREDFINTLAHDEEFQKKTNSTLRNDYVYNHIFKMPTSIYDRFRSYYDHDGDDRLYLANLIVLAAKRAKEKNSKSR